MKVLVINCGSSSLKYQLIDSETESVLAKGLCERIGIDGALTHQPAGKDKIKSTPAMPDHKTAIGIVIDQLTDKENGVVESLDEIGAVGHRIVHGGEKFTKSCLITDEVIKEVEECSVFAPLHNPAGLIGVRACQELMPGLPMVAVFDTAFHQTMPEKAFLYGTFGMGFTNAQVAINYHLSGDIPSGVGTPSQILLAEGANTQEGINLIQSYVSRAGYAFTGWNTDSITGARYAGSTCQNTSVNLYGQYTKLYGNLTISKRLGGPSQDFLNTIPNGNKTFTFNLSGTADCGDYINNNYTVVSGTDSTFYNIPVGTYTLTATGLKVARIDVYVDDVIAD